MSGLTPGGSCREAPATRTVAWIGDTEKSGLACSGCGTSYEKCTQRVLAGKNPRACCPACRQTDTHDEQVIGTRVDPEDERRVRRIEVVAETLYAQMWKKPAWSSRQTGENEREKWRIKAAPIVDALDRMEES